MSLVIRSTETIPGALVGHKVMKQDERREDNMLVRIALADGFTASVETDMFGKVQLTLANSGTLMMLNQEQVNLLLDAIAEVYSDNDQVDTLLDAITKAYGSDE